MHADPMIELDDEIPADNSTKKIVNNNTNEIFKEIDAAERQNGNDAAMITTSKRQNDNDFNHSAYEEFLEEEIAQVHVSDSEEEDVAETQIMLQQPALPHM
ncbi:hypothetical protein L195_g023236 [Trifolium pratense]|uniref:Uncharacterized protein n=1 Tax=Trifolium pratense TaxID=57577 RepID=A0A2K3NA94_TRIPR|nr:hypothetical protein L195_g023236 [Trifolium pratense]